MPTDADRSVSIIIPAYADTPNLRRAVWSIQQTADMPYQLVVSLAQQSVAKNRNAGLDRAEHDLVVFMDDDVLLPARWLSTLVAVLDAHEDIGAVSARPIFPDGSPQTHRYELEPGELWDIMPAGTCFAYSRERVGDQRFDEYYRGSQWEDIDWMHTVRELGLRTVITADVVVIHDHTEAQNHWYVENGTHYHGKWLELPTENDQSPISREAHAAWKPPPLP